MPNFAQPSATEHSSGRLNEAALVFHLGWDLPVHKSLLPELA